ncbi:hypothetical protein EYF80_045419 [Liparis tanakae]|uniref:Uncharacterized protein n=1 Tax=Liparis tanakae TaxID=230148 RepID=A0A4Z2FVN4_9TELE|nr:hypothetical protein EYF80_045419 [Liparis tanakae]
MLSTGSPGRKYCSLDVLRMMTEGTATSLRIPPDRHPQGASLEGNTSCFYWGTCGNTENHSREINKPRGARRNVASPTGTKSEDFHFFFK